ncbi:MAG: CTP synthase [Dehalococcoidia bacterium]
MSSAVIIGVVGDFDGRTSHVATNQAIGHAAARLGIDATVRWLPTPPLLAPGGEAILAVCDGLWAAPGSPYASMDGALAGIRFAREHDRPFTGT